MWEDMVFPFQLLQTMYMPLVGKDLPKAKDDLHATQQLFYADGGLTQACSRKLAAGTLAIPIPQCTRTGPTWRGQLLLLSAALHHLPDRQAKGLCKLKVP